MTTVRKTKRTIRDAERTRTVEAWRWAWFCQTPGSEAEARCEARAVRT
jgi:hypothetical protein